MATLRLSLALLVLLAVLSAATVCPAQQTDLTSFEWGPMPTASESVPDMTYRPRFVTDGKADTGWVAPIPPQTNLGASDFTSNAVWLRLEWRFPVTVHQVELRQFIGSPFRDLKSVQSVLLQADLPRPLAPPATKQMWSDVAGGIATGLTLDQPVTLTLSKPVRTQALRVLLQGQIGQFVGVSEFKVLGEKPVLPKQFFPTWQARWIWVEPTLVIPHREPTRIYMRRSFEIADPAQIKEAWLLGTALDRCTMWLNAHEALKDISYAGGVVRQAQVKQIPLNWLQKGENVLAAKVDDIYEVGSRGLLAELILIGQDGQRTIIPTDDKWQTQADPGPTPDWQKPGYKDARYMPAQPHSGPNSLWHWIIAVPYPTVAPQDQVRVAAVTMTPQPLQPGKQAEVTVALETTAPLESDYAVALRLGQESHWREFDYELWGAVAKPEDLKTSQWRPGRHEVKLTVDTPPESPNPLPATLMLTTPQGAAGLQSDLPGAISDAYGLHLTLPTVRPVAVASKPTPARDFPKAEIKSVDGNPTLLIDGQRTAPIIWSSAYGNYKRYHEYASTGVKIFRPLIGGSAVAAPGEEEEYYRWWFAEVDRMVQAALDVDPQIKLLPAVWLDPNPDWLFQHPEDQYQSGRGVSMIPILIAYPERGQVRPTFMSQSWRRAGAEGLKRLVQHMRAQPYAPNIIGLIFFAGRAGENYYGGNELNLFMNEKNEWDAKPRAQWDLGDLSMAARRTFREFVIAKYKTDAALQQAWQNPNVHFDDILEPARFRREDVINTLVWANHGKQDGNLRDPLTPGVGLLPMDYFQCFSEAMQQSFAEWGRAVKEASDNRLLTGTYYGYTLAHLFTEVPGFAGHTAADQAARTPYVDIYVSPAEYDESRRQGGHLWSHNIPDSLRLHNKLFVYEADTRTYLADIQPKQFSLRETLEVLKRDAAAALVRGNGWWWYEFSDAQRGANAREWFADPDIQSLAAQLKKLNDYALTLPDRGPSSQIAIFYHGETHTAQDIFSSIPLNIDIGRMTLVEGVQNIGAPYDIYNLADLADLQKSGKLAQYKLCLFLNPFYLRPEEVKLLELAKGGGRTLVWLYAPGLAQPGKHLAAENVEPIIGMKGLKLLNEPIDPTMRFTDASTPVTAGLAPNYELAPRYFQPGQTWARNGNFLQPFPYLDPAQAGEAKLIGRWVMNGQVRQDMGAFAIQKFTGWTSVYSACPYLPIELMRNLAKFAGVHVYRDSNDVLYADKHFVVIHTGAHPAKDTLRLPQATPVYDVFGGKLLSPKTDSLPLDIPAYTTALYYLGDPAKLEAALR